MALTEKTLSGIVGPGGNVPSVFTYSTPDTIAAITTAGYFNSLAGGIKPNDVIYAIVLADTVPVLSVIICVKAEYTDGVGFDTDFSVISTFAGDVRATDTAGLQLQNLGGNLGAGGGANAPIKRLFTYRNNTDTILLISGANYFNDATALLVGDIILTVSVDDFAYLRVTDVTVGAVTTEVITFAP